MDHAGIERDRRELKLYRQGKKVRAPRMIRAELTSPNVAALAAASILARVLQQDQQKWTCRACRYSKNSRLSEICEGCGREDLEQGEHKWNG